jgi:alpha-tubulin suppressor-like RCC1 family protein
MRDDLRCDSGSAGCDHVKRARCQLLAPVVGLFVLITGVFVSGSNIATAAPVRPAAPTPPALYRPIVPARLVDTRPGYSTVDGTGAPGQALGAGATLAVTVLGRGGIPSTNVAAVVLNVTVTNPTQPSFLTVWPSGANRPTASNLNFIAGQTVPNLVIAKLGTDHLVDVFNAAGTADVIVDVTGYFPTSDPFVPLVPARLMETRSNLPTIDGASRRGAPLGAGEQVDLPVSGRGGVPATGVDSVVLNVTATNPTRDSFVTVWPAGADRPVASNLNVVPNVTAPNLVIAKLGTAGAVSIYNLAGSTDIVVDVEGYYPTGGAFVSLTPARVLETRPGLPVAPGGTQRGMWIGDAQTIELQVLGAGGVPDSGVSAVVLNVTAIHPTGPSYITVWPTGASRPLASNLNLTHAGQVIPNLVVAKVGARGFVSIFNQSGLTDMAVDVAGYFVTEPSFVRSLSTSYQSTCALREIGTITCWGLHDQDRYGVFWAPPTLPFPEELRTLDDAVEVTVGALHSCALRADATVWCWGGSSFGEVGIGVTDQYNVWPPVRLTDLTDVVGIDAAAYHTCALKADGTVACWGDAHHWPPTMTRPQPIAGLSDIVQIAAGDNADCALHETGTVSCWGIYGALGVLGDGSGTVSPTPVTVSGLTDADSVTVMGLRACATRRTGEAVCWGNSFLGSGSTGGSLVPVPILDSLTGLPANDIVQVDGGDDYVCALRADAQVYCFGSEFYGSLGLAPSSSVSTTTLTSPTAGLPEIASISADRFHMCAMTFAAEVYCWGSNSSGQIGDGTTVNRSTPVLVLA